MSGFYITVKNDLLEPKHIKAMGGDSGCGALWLFLWLLDKMTIIDHEKGEGKVWGGRPVHFDHVKESLGISPRSYARWVKVLREGGYISTTRTPYGLSIIVYKAFKVFGQSVENKGKEEKRSATTGISLDASRHISPTLGGTSNKTRHLDNTLDIKKDPLKELTEKIAIQESQKIDHEYIVKVAKEHSFTVVETTDELCAFIQFWTESNAKGKQRWQQEKFFEVNRRLATWFRNKHQYRKDLKCRSGVWHKRGDQCQCERIQKQKEDSRIFEQTTTPQDRERINARLAELRKTLAAKMDVTKKQSVPAG